MQPKINLAPEEKKKGNSIINASVFSGTIILFILCIVVVIGIYIYGLILTQQRDALQNEIVRLDTEIESLKDVEERKSLVTIKTNQIKKVYDSRFDYVQAIDDVQKLFSYSLTPTEIVLQKTGIVKVTAEKTGPITISSESALTTKISVLNLMLTVTSSTELQESVETLKSYLGKGLTQADVVSTEKTDNGYEVEFSIKFNNTASVTPTQ